MSFTGLRGGRGLALFKRCRKLRTLKAIQCTQFFAVASTADEESGGGGGGGSSGSIDLAFDFDAALAAELELHAHIAALQVTPHAARRGREEKSVLQLCRRPLPAPRCLSRSDAL